MAAHKWIDRDTTPNTKWFKYFGCHDLRECANCGAVQVKEADHEWMRVTGYYWTPKVGHCRGMKFLPEDLVQLPDRTIVTSGQYPTTVFKEQFSPDRYGKEAFKKAHKYGKGFIGKIIFVDLTAYTVTGYDIMVGSCDYVGSLLLSIEEYKL
jgi:hypothetical protein